MHELWVWHPPIGVWIGILGVLGIIVPLIRDIAKIGKGEKAIWTAVMFVLLLLELKTLYQDRSEHDREQAEARAEQLRQFESIARGINQTLETSQNEFASTMERSNQIMTAVGTSIKTQTGGDSFGYLTFTPESANLRFNGSPPSSSPQFMVSITSRGKYPLRETHCTLMDDGRRLQAVQEYNKHPDGNWINAINSTDRTYYIPYLRPQSTEAPTGDVEMLDLIPMGPNDSDDVTVACSSFNGYWNERLHLRRVNGQWHQALSVMGPTVKQALRPFIFFDPDYPEGKAIAEKDWSHTPAKQATAKLK